MMPNDAAMVTAILRGMPAAELAAVAPRDFQRWPTPVITPAATLRELILNERARRSGTGPELALEVAV